MTRTMVEPSKKERRNTGGSKTRTAVRKLATKRDGHLKLHVPSESGGEEEHDDFEDVDENDDDEDEDVSEEGMKILMTLVGEEDLDEFEKAQLAIEDEEEDEETDEEEEDDENEELDDKEEGSLADGEDEEMEGVRCCVSYPFDGILYANSIRSAKTSSRGFHHRIPNRPRRCTPR